MRDVEACKNHISYAIDHSEAQILNAIPRRAISWNHFPRERVTMREKVGGEDWYADLSADWA